MTFIFPQEKPRKREGKDEEKAALGSGFLIPASSSSAPTFKDQNQLSTIVNPSSILSSQKPGISLVQTGDLTLDVTNKETLQVVV